MTQKNLGLFTCWSRFVSQFHDPEAGYSIARPTWSPTPIRWPDRLGNRRNQDDIPLVLVFRIWRCANQIEGGIIVLRARRLAIRRFLQYLSSGSAAYSGRFPFPAVLQDPEQPVSGKQRCQPAFTFILGSRSGSSPGSLPWAFAMRESWTPSFYW